MSPHIYTSSWYLPGTRYDLRRTRSLMKYGNSKCHFRETHTPQEYNRIQTQDFSPIPPQLWCS